MDNTESMDDIQDLLALGGSISRQINMSNSMMLEQGKSTIPRIDPRVLIQNAQKSGGRPPSLPPLPTDQGNIVLADPDMQGLRVTPMAPLIPLEEALNDELRKKGVTGADFVTRTPVSNQPVMRTVHAPQTIQVQPEVAQIDTNQIEFGFIDKLGKPRYSNIMEYLDEKFLTIEMKQDKILEKLNLLLGKKKRL